MKKGIIYKGLKWLAGGLLVLLIGLMIMAQFVEFRSNDTDLKNEFGLLSIRSDIKRYKVEKRTIRYIELGKESLPVTILT